jgi:hypothetical protein
MANSHFLAALAFIVIAVAWTSVGVKSNNLTFKSIRNHTSYQAMVQGMGFLAFCLYLLGFWVLTRVFSFYLVLVMILVLLAGALLTNLMGAITGFTLPATQKKIAGLRSIWGVIGHPAKGCILGILGILILLLSTLGPLYVFWSHPIGDPKAKVVVSFFLFTLSGIISLLISVVFSWPIVTSAYIDDDFRNSEVIRQFSAVLLSTIYLLFPLLLFQNETRTYFAQRGWYLPPIWVFFSIPLLAYIFGALIPFIAGIYHYRLQRNSMIQWRQRWLAEFTSALKSPPPLRAQGISANIRSLASAVQDLADQNELLSHYQRLLTLEKGSGDPSGITAADISNLLPSQSPPEPEPDGQTLDLSPGGIQKALTRLLNKTPLPIHLKNQNSASVLADVIKENEIYLVDWDIRVGHLAKLQRYAQLALLANTADVQPAIDEESKAADKELDSGGTAKNVLASVMLTGITSTVVFFFHRYNEQIFAFIAKIARNHS